MSRARRFVLRGLLAAFACACASAQEGVLQDLNEALGRARYADALQLTDELSDPALAAEWRSYLYGVAGDVPAALREARAGLQHAPAHAGLLTQALNASLTLGLAPSAGDLAQRLLAATQDDPALAAQAAELAGFARELTLRDDLAERSIGRARAVAVTGLLAALLALALLARGRPAAGPASDAD